MSIALFRDCVSKVWSTSAQDSKRGSFQCQLGPRASGQQTFEVTEMMILEKRRMRKSTSCHGVASKLITDIGRSEAVSTKLVMQNNRQPTHPVQAYLVPDLPNVDFTSDTQPGTISFADLVCLASHSSKLKSGFEVSCRSFRYFVTGS